MRGWSPARGFSIPVEKKRRDGEMVLWCTGKVPQPSSKKHTSGREGSISASSRARFFSTLFRFPLISLPCRIWLEMEG
jgi:hypothetical protein